MTDRMGRGHLRRTAERWSSTPIPPCHARCTQRHGRYIALQQSTGCTKNRTSNNSRHQEPLAIGLPALKHTVTPRRLLDRMSDHTIQWSTRGERMSGGLSLVVQNGAWNQLTHRVLRMVILNTARGDGAVAGDGRGLVRFDRQQEWRYSTVTAVESTTLTADPARVQQQDTAQ